MNKAEILYGLIVTKIKKNASKNRRKVATATNNSPCIFFCVRFCSFLPVHIENTAFLLAIVYILCVKERTLSVVTWLHVFRKI